MSRPTRPNNTHQPQMCGLVSVSWPSRPTNAHQAAHLGLVSGVTCQRRVGLHFLHLFWLISDDTKQNHLLYRCHVCDWDELPPPLALVG